MKQLAALLAACLGIAFQLSAAAQPAPPATFLQLDPGAHWAPARRVAISPDQRHVATASDDKTVRIWRSDDRTLEQVLRPPIGPGAGGRLYGVAFHPSLPLIAVGGTSVARDGGRIYLFDPESGEYRRTIDTGPGDVKRLAWSRDGRWLIAAFAAPGGVRVFSTEGRETSAVRFDGDCYGLDVHDGPQVVATDLSGKVHFFRLSDAGVLQRTASVASSAALPVSVSFAPDGMRVALVHFALDRNGVVDIISAQDGAVLDVLRAPATGGGQTQAVEWGRSGTRLAIGGVRTGASVAGRDRIESFRGFVAEFNLQTRTATPIVEVASDSVTDLERLADGRLVFSSFDSTWGIVEPGAVRAPRTIDYVRRSDRLWISPSGAGVQWQTPQDPAPVHFALSDRVVRPGRLGDAAAPDVSMSDSNRWESEAPGLAPRILGANVAVVTGETSRAVARIPGSDNVAWGTTQRLARVARGGRVVWSVEPGTETRSVHGSADGRLVVGAFSDGTVRWYRASDGQLLLSLFATQARQWVLWTPGGFYDASPGAETLIGWQVNAEGGDAGRNFSIGRFRDRFFRPDVIDRILSEADEGSAVRVADRSRAEALAELAKPVPAAAPVTTPARVPLPSPVVAPERPIAAAPVVMPVPAKPLPPPTAPAPVLAAAAPAPPPEILKALPPSLVYKQSAAVIAASERVTLAFGVVLPTGEKLVSLLVRRDGTQQAPAVHLPASYDGKSAGSVTLEVPEGDSLVHIVAEGANGFSDALAFKVHRAAEPAPTAARKVEPSPAPSIATRIAAPRPRLFVLAIGVSLYADAEVSQLQLASKDAKDFAAVFNSQSGRAYERVETRVLTDGNATREAIVQGLAWLSSSVKEKDFGILFMAGHAVNHPNGSYYFLAHDSVPARLPATAVEHAGIRSALSRLKGRAVLFIDTCHASNAFSAKRGFSRDISKVVNELASPENGIIVFASSTGRQDSLESDDWGNGAFTKAVVAGLKGGADLMRRGSVTFQGLGYYVSAEVEKLTKGLQTPVLISPPPGLPDFTLALTPVERAEIRRGMDLLAMRGASP